MPLSLHLFQRRAIRRLPVLLACMALGACSTYADQSSRLRGAALAGDRSAALSMIDKESGSEPDLLALLQRGILHFEEGQYSAATIDFSQADSALDATFTKSISQEALSFLTNDATRDYVPYPSEQVLLHVYAGLAYLGLDDRQGALVEFRKVGERLQAMEDLRADAEGYHDDPFAQWLAAMLFADDADANACLVSCRRALAAFQDETTVWGRPVPTAFLADYYEWAGRFGFSEEADELAERFDTIDVSPVRAGTGEVVLLYARGFVDHLAELRIDFPLLESDHPVEDDDYARTVYRRGRRGRYVRHDNVKIKYWLSVAVPILVENEFEPGGVRITVGNVSRPGTEVADISSAFGLTFHEGDGRRTVRTIIRALAKYLTVESVKKDKDGKEHKVAGFLANLVAAATERADTRSWSLLPNEFQMARIRLPEGTHRVQVEMLNGAGHVTRTADYEMVSVVAGQHTILYERSYR